MKVIIAGSRNLRDITEVIRAVEASGFSVTEVVSGNAKGADALGEIWAMTNGVALRKFPADWNKYGKAAGPVRNTQMAEYGDALIACWDGESKGTKHMIDQMKKLGKPFYVHLVNSSL